VLTNNMRKIDKHHDGFNANLNGEVARYQYGRYRYDIENIWYPTKKYNFFSFMTTDARHRSGTGTREFLWIADPKTSLIVPWRLYKIKTRRRYSLLILEEAELVGLLPSSTHVDVTLAKKSLDKLDDLKELERDLVLEAADHIEGFF